VSYVVDGTDQTYFLCDEDIYSEGCGNTIYVSGETTVVGATDSGSGAIVEAAFVCDAAPKLYDFEKAYCPPEGEGCRVDLDTVVSGDFQGLAQTVREAAGDQIPEGGFTYYLAGGAGDDTILGSKCNDFIRGNAGADTIRAAAGDDLIRPGAGNDVIRTGMGKDIVYFTPDAFVDGDTNTIEDFTSGEDKISFKGAAADFNIQGVGSKRLTVTLGEETITVVSDNTTFLAQDIQFIA
jgi:Ca2+-binding RTX toxin-like protein